MKKIFLLLCLTGAFFNDGFTQGTITVDATGEVTVAADIASLRVNISVTDDTPADVFALHKQQEEYLTTIVKEYHLTGDKLNFQPMSIGSRQTRDSREFRSSQSVHMRIDDFDLFEKIQVLLIENGFENFSGSFSSTLLEEAENRALDTAISNAREKAQRIAENIGKTLGDIKSVEHTVYRSRPPEALQFAEMRADTGSLMEFEQSIPVTSNITIIYYLNGLDH